MKPTSNTQTDSLLVAAKQALTKGEFNHVVDLFNNVDFAQLSPSEQVECEYFVAVAYRYLKQFSAAKTALSRLLSLDPSHSRAWQEQGHLFLALQENAQAANAFHQATSINPALVSSWRALTTLYEKNSKTPTIVAALNHAQENWAYWSSLPAPLTGAADLMYSGELEKADTVCRQYLQKHKHHVNGLYVLALIDIQASVYDEAEFLLESCCELAPSHHRARAELSGLLNRIGKYPTALAHAKKLLNHVPDDANFLVLAGVANTGLGELETGIKLFKQVLEAEPQRPGLWLQLGHAYKSLGSLEKAEHAYKQALLYKQDFGDVFWSLANTKAYRFSKDEMHNMASLLTQPLQTEDRIHIEFALAKGLEDQQDFEAAFAHYEKGNALKYKTCRYHPDQFTQQVNKHIEFFNDVLFEQLKKSGSNDAAPIFIVGLPRAGSTLLEQILSSHSQVDATLELHNILSLVKRLNKDHTYPNMLSDLDTHYLTRFGEQFIQQTRAFRQEAPFFIDKMPNNFLHIGLIKLILPKAKIIDARRDPMDCCYSGFKQLFAEGQEFSYDLTAVGRYYQDYVRLMKHWDEVLPGFVLRVQHEDVLDDLEGQVARMLDFCGLPFESDCLTFHKTERAIQTPSAAQVRQPINRSGVGRWKAVEHKLEQLKQALNTP